MKTRQITHAETFPASQQQLFDLLVTPSAIRSWWSVARAIVIPAEGGIWMAAWGDDEDEPDYVTAATILTWQPPHQLVLGNYQYHARSGPLPFDADFTTSFEVTDASDGAVLQVTQDGFPVDPSADEYYSACSTGWERTFAGIREFLART